MAAETWDGYQYGPCPTLFMFPIRDDRGSVSSSVSNYNPGSSDDYCWIPMLAAYATGDGIRDEHGNNGFWRASDYSVNTMIDHGSDGTWWYSLIPHYYLELTSGTGASTLSQV